MVCGAWRRSSKGGNRSASLSDACSHAAEAELRRCHAWRTRRDARATRIAPMDGNRRVLLEGRERRTPESIIGCCGHEESGDAQRSEERRVGKERRAGG